METIEDTSILKQCKYLTCIHTIIISNKLYFEKERIAYSFYIHKETNELYIKLRMHSVCCVGPDDLIVRLEAITTFIYYYNIWFLYPKIIPSYQRNYWNKYNKIRDKNLLKKVPQLKAYFALELL